MLWKLFSLVRTLHAWWMHTLLMLILLLLVFMKGIDALGHCWVLPWSVMVILDQITSLLLTSLFAQLYLVLLILHEKLNSISPIFHRLLFGILEVIISVASYLLCLQTDFLNVLVPCFINFFQNLQFLFFFAFLFQDEALTTFLSHLIQIVLSVPYLHQSYELLCWCVRWFCYLLKRFVCNGGFS